MTQRYRWWIGQGILGLGVVGVLALAPGHGGSLTSPLAGGVSKPGDFDLRLPFSNGTRVYVTAGYSPGGGSSLHSNLNAGDRGNDYYALDLTLPDHGNNGLGQPVLAAASGTVVKAGWATAGWANFGQRVIIRHDYSDGNTWVTHYAHLNAITVREGDHVNQGQQIGELGDSCEGDSQNLSCPHFGPHLHFGLHRNSNIGGSGTGGSYGGNAAVPEPISGAQDLGRGQTLVSDNSGAPAQPCEVIEGGEKILDNGSRCFSRRGPEQYWHQEGSGHGGDAIWTYTIADPAPDNYVYWNLHFANGGRYDLWAYIPADFGQSRQAKYKIRRNGGEETAQRDQTSARNDWLHLGQYEFAGGGDQWVLLEDNTGEPYTGTSSTRIAFDALRIRPAQSCECSGGETQTEGCGMCGQRARTCDGCRWSGWSGCDNEGECSQGSVEEESCEGTGTHSRSCDGACAWQAWSACEGGSGNNDPGNNSAANNTPSNNDPGNNDPGNNGGSNNTPGNNDPGNNSAANNSGVGNNAGNNAADNNAPSNNSGASNNAGPGDDADDEEANNSAVTASTCGVAGAGRGGSAAPWGLVVVLGMFAGLVSAARRRRSRRR